VITVSRDVVIDVRRQWYTVLQASMQAGMVTHDLGS
jgi:hypothetical protein